MAVPIGLTTTTRRHDPDSVMSQYLGCGPDQTHLYHTNLYHTFFGPQDWESTWYGPIPSTRLGSGRSIRGHRFSMWEAPLPVRSAVPRALRSLSMTNAYHVVDLSAHDPLSGGWLHTDSEIADIEATSARMEYLKSITKEETVEERAQKEKRARKKERRQERKARDLECKAQQRRARNQFRKGP